MKRSVPWRRWLLLLAFILLSLLVVTRFTSAQNLLATLGQGHWQWILVATVLHLLYFVLYAGLYWLGFAAVGVDSAVVRLLPVMMASIFVNAVIPSGGAGGAALFVDDAIRSGQSGARATVGVLLVLLADLGTMIPLIVFAVVFLLGQSAALIGVVVIAASFYAVFVIGLSTILWLSHVRPMWGYRLLRWIQRVVDRVGSWFRRPYLLAEDWAQRNASEFTEGTRAIAQHPRELILALLWIFFLHGFNIAGLYALFLAFEQPVSPSLLIAGFSLGIVFAVITIIPQGVGTVEGIMGLIFIGAGLPGNKVAAIVLSFRGLNLWLPLLVGFIFFNRVVSARSRRPLPPDEREEQNSSQPWQDDDDSGPPAGAG